MVGSRGAGPLLCAVTRGLDWRRKVLLLVVVSWGCVEEGSWAAEDDELVPLALLLLLAETRAARIALTASSRGAHSASTLSWAS